MPRSAPKSQADKRGHRSSVQVSPPPTNELEAEDIIPGRLTKAQWTQMLIQEEGEDTVGEIMEELLSKVMEGCFKVYIERQLAPFSAFWAKSYITKILEQQILCPDEGEGPAEASRTEDTEPMPATLDTWAQGCVPVVIGTPRAHSTSPQNDGVGQVPVKTEPRVNQQSHVMAQTSRSPKQSEKERGARRPVSDEPYKGLSPRPPPKVDRKKKQQRVNLPLKPIPGKLLPPLSCSSEKKDVEGKYRTHSDSNHSTESSYQRKDRQPIPKIDPSRLPRHCIVPQYEILDDDCTKHNSKKPSSRVSKLEPKHNKQQREWISTSLKPLRSSEEQNTPGKFQNRNEADIWLKKLSPSRPMQERLVFSGPLRLDTMDLAKGVSLRDPQAVDISLFKCNNPPPDQSTKLRLIRSDAAVPLLSVDQVTAGPPPKVTPLVQSKNC